MASGIDAHNFYQSLWTFKKILGQRVRTHADVGSQVSFIGLLTAATQVTFLDIRLLAAHRLSQVGGLTYDRNPDNWDPPSKLRIGDA
jgi:hypothetical protein